MVFIYFIILFSPPALESLRTAKKPPPDLEKQTVKTWLAKPDSNRTVKGLVRMNWANWQMQILL